MEERLKGIKKELKKQVSLKARKQVKKQVKALGKLPKTKKKAVSLKKKPSARY